VRLDSFLALTVIGPSSFALYQPSARLYYSALSLAGIVGGLSIPKAAAQPPMMAIRRLVISFGSVGSVLSLFLFLVLLFTVGPVFGEEFVPTFEVAYTLAVTLFLRFLGAGLGAFLTICGYQRERARVSVIVFAFSCIAVLCVYFIFYPTLLAILYVLLGGQVINIFLFLILSVVRLRCG
jgi:O-antigen/teichoic acid export membrane protein